MYGNIIIIYVSLYVLVIGNSKLDIIMIKVCHVMLWHAIYTVSCHTLMCHVISYSDVSCHVLVCHVPATTPHPASHQPLCHVGIHHPATTVYLLTMLEAYVHYSSQPVYCGVPQGIHFSPAMCNTSYIVCKHYMQ